MRRVLVIIYSVIICPLILSISQRSTKLSCKNRRRNWLISELNLVSAFYSPTDIAIIGDIWTAFIITIGTNRYNNNVFIFKKWSVFIWWGVLFLIRFECLIYFNISVEAKLLPYLIKDSYNFRKIWTHRSWCVNNQKYCHLISFIKSTWIYSN